MKKIIFFFVLVSLLLMNFYFFRENRSLKKIIGKLEQENENGKMKIEKTAENSRLLGLFFKGILSEGEDDIRQFGDAINNSEDDEMKNRYGELIDSSSGDALINFGGYINNKNLEIFNK